MVTARQRENAVKLCAGLEEEETPDDFVDARVEEDEDGNGLGEIGVADGETHDTLEPVQNMETPAEKSLPKSKSSDGRRKGMDPDVARFIVAKRCYVKILDSVFKNPPHIPCIEVGACALCAERKVRGKPGTSTDIRTADQAIKREELEAELNKDEETKRKRKSTAGNRGGDKLCRFKHSLREWRLEKSKDLTKTRYLATEDVATDKALDAMARSRKMVDVSSLEALEPQWPQRNEWGEELVQFLHELEQEIVREKQELEDEKNREKEARKAEKEAEKEAKEAEREAKKAGKEAEKAANRGRGRGSGRGRGAHTAIPNLGHPAAPQTPPAQPRPTNVPPMYHQPVQQPVVSTSTGRVVVGADGRTRLVPQPPPFVHTPPFATPAAFRPYYGHYPYPTPSPHMS